jgi:hypothetical protein
MLWIFLSTVIPFFLNYFIIFPLLSPFSRYFIVSDPSISYPNDNFTFPPYFPVLFWICSSVVILLTYMRKQKTWKFILLCFFYWLLGLTCSVLITYQLTTILQYQTGILRPDFLFRCKPTLAEGTPICTGDEHQIRIGRMSFPDRFTSLTTSITTYTVLFLLFEFKRFTQKKMLNQGSSLSPPVIIDQISSPYTPATARTQIISNNEATIHVSGTPTTFVNVDEVLIIAENISDKRHFWRFLCYNSCFSFFFFLLILIFIGVPLYTGIENIRHYNSHVIDVCGGVIMGNFISFILFCITKERVKCIK